MVIGWSSLLRNRDQNRRYITRSLVGPPTGFGKICFMGLGANPIIRPNKKISVFRVTGLNSLGRVGTHIFFNYFLYSGKKYNFMHFERHLAFQNT